jgi:hypothetical protein
MNLQLWRLHSAGDRSTSVSDVTTDAAGVLSLPIDACDAAITAYVLAFTDAQAPVNGINTQAQDVHVRPGATC